MKAIPPDIVERIWKELAALPPEKAGKAVDELRREQPVILAYLMATGDADLETRKERELVLYLGIAVWRMMSQGDNPPRPVSEAVLEGMENANLKMLEYFEHEPPVDLKDTLETMMEGYNQKHVLKYVIEALEEPESALPLTPESKGTAFICLKTVIDCLDG